MRAHENVEELRNNREQIVITEIPYQVNKSTLIQRIADLVNQERITEISEIRDESDREGIRVVIMLKRSANPGVVLNQLYKYTQMQQTFGVINLDIVKVLSNIMAHNEL